MWWYASSWTICGELDVLFLPRLLLVYIQQELNERTDSTHPKGKDG